MVLFKRKPLKLIPVPEGLTDDQEIWVMEGTGEIFTSYEAYVERLTFLEQTKFLCEVTGESGMDYFTALEKENDAAEGIDKVFPDALREPVLRKTQHSIISRIDNLVDWVHAQFKNDFYPGERVVVTVDDVTQGRLHGVVREKVKFSGKYDANGVLLQRPYHRYFVVLTDRPDAEALVDDEHIFRDRKVFSKAMLKNYLRNSITREAWNGAPWQIKAPLAQKYRIDQTIPPHLRYEAALIQRKMKILEAKNPNTSITDLLSAADTSITDYDVKGPKAKKTAQRLDLEKQSRMKEFQDLFANDPNLDSLKRNGKFSQAQALKHLQQEEESEMEEAPAPPTPAIKYPREDLDNPTLPYTRPQLKFLQDTVGSDIKSETVGILLEVWDFFSVYSEVLVIDPCQFDDFVEALRSDFLSELVTEMHCALLKLFVNDERDLNGKVHIKLPAEDDEEEDEEEEEEATGPSTPEPDFKRMTRRSLAKTEAEEAKAQAAIDAKIHLGAEIDKCIPGNDWKTRLRKREFANGKWIVVIVGLFNLFTLKPQFKATCEAILAKLAPPDAEASEETAITQYSLLDINDKATILQLLKTLVMETSAIRDYMEECSAQMTQYRKEKVDWQRKRKEYLAEIKELDEERRKLQPGVTAEAQEIAELTQELEDTEMVDVEEDRTMNGTEADEDEDVAPRSLRRGKDRESQRKKKAEEEKRRKEEAKIANAKKPSKEAKALDKVLNKIEKAKEMVKKCEAEIVIVDEDLRQNDCPRLRILGRDRFYNRYYWFERNAMPYGGLPDTSTSFAEYMNGCLWVQGPDKFEFDGFLNLRDFENAAYAHVCGTSMPERRNQEEGYTQLSDSTEWAYFDTPEELDSLLGWLSEKGTRESKLRKEIMAQREQIELRMEKRKIYLEGNSSRSQSAEPVTRISTRTKTYVDPAGHRFMKWHNSSAKEELGHIHSEQPRLVKKPREKLEKAVVSRSNKRKSEDTEELPAKRTRGRTTAKVVEVDANATTTRRGTRYNR